VRDRRSDDGIRVMAPWIHPWVQRNAEHVQPLEVEPQPLLAHVGLRREAIRATVRGIHLPAGISARRRTGRGTGTGTGRGTARSASWEEPAGVRALRATPDRLLGHPYQIGHLAGRAAPGWREARDRAIFQA